MKKTRYAFFARCFVIYEVHFWEEMFGHEWVSEIHDCNYRLHTNCCWSFKLKITVSYKGNTKLTR
jgi:hypothetical protein